MRSSRFFVPSAPPATIYFPSMDVSDLLTEIREGRSEAAFEQVMRRYARLVHSVVLRRLRDPSLADECAQEVFVDLARMAPRLRNEGELVGWLHATAHRVAVDRWRRETRRRNREQKAALMPEIQEPDDSHWREIAPVLDEVLAELPSADRQAVLLRYFQHESLREVGRALGLTEDAAKMRVRRALERLHVLLVRRGVGCTVVALAALLDQRAVEAGSMAIGENWVAARLLDRAGPAGSGLVLVQAGVELMKTKMLLLLLAAALGVWWWWPRSSSLTSGSDPERGRSPAASAEASRDLVARFRRARPGAVSAADSVVPSDRLTRLREVLRGARRVTTYPPASLAEALWSCSDIADEAAAILAEALGSPDYETRHWAVEGLAFMLEDAGLRGGHDTARLALARVGASGTEPDEIRMRSLTSLLAPWSRGIDGEPARTEPITPEILSILASSFGTPGIDAVSHNMLLATLLGPALRIGAVDDSELRRQLTRWVQTGDVNQQLGAAFALTELSGGQSAAAKDVLVRALTESTERTPVAMTARALARFGAEAEDALPILEQLHARNTSSGITRTELERAMIAIQPDLAAKYPGGSAESARQTAEAEKGDAEARALPSIRSQLLDPLLELVRDPAQREQFPVDWTMSTTARLVEPLREAVRKQSTIESDPAVAKFLEGLADRITPVFGSENEVPLASNLPDVRELVSRAEGIAGYPESGVSAATVERVRQLQSKYGPGVFGDRAPTPELLRQVAAELRAVDETLYQAAMKSFLEGHPELDRIFR